MSQRAAALVAAATLALPVFASPASTAAAPSAAPRAVAVDLRGVGRRIKTTWNRLVRPRSAQPKGTQPMRTPARMVQPGPVHQAARGVAVAAPSRGAAPVGVVPVGVVPVGVVRRAAVAPARAPLVPPNAGLAPRGPAAPVVTQWERPMQPQPSAPPLTLRLPAVTGPRVTTTAWQPLDARFADKQGVTYSPVVKGVKPIHTVGGVRVEITSRTAQQLQASQVAFAQKARAAGLVAPRAAGISPTEARLRQLVGASPVPIAQVKSSAPPPVPPRRGP